jgi:hypothetical protein
MRILIENVKWKSENKLNQIGSFKFSPNSRDSLLFILVVI